MIRYQTNHQQFHPEQVPQYNQMVNNEGPMEDKVMTNLAVHQNLYMDQQQQPQQFPMPPPGMTRQWM